MAAIYKGYLFPELPDDNMDTESYYSERLEGCTFENGDKATGEFYRENMTVLFMAEDKDGQIYETPEIPALRLDITLIRFNDGTGENEVKESLKSIKK